MIILRKQKKNDKFTIKIKIDSPKAGEIIIAGLVIVSITILAVVKTIL